MIPSRTQARSRPVSRVQAEFARALPRIRRHAVIVFRSVRCIDTRDDCVAEVLAMCWAWWLRLRQRNRDPQQFVSVLAGFAAKAVKSGRRLCGQERAKEALSPHTRRRHGFSARSLPTTFGSSQRRADELDECLRDNTQTPVPDQAAFRLDFRRWLARHRGRARRLVEAMLLGETTQALARRFALSPARISQLRREFLDGWNAFQGEAM